MNTIESFPHFKITKKGELFLKAGHNWVFEDEITESPECENGSLVSVFNDKDKFIGTGFLSLNSKIRVRIISNNKNDKFDAAFWRRRFEYAWQYRKNVMRNEDLNACRIIFGEADGFPGLTIDKFSDILVVQILSFGIDKIKHWLLLILINVLEEDGHYISGVFERNDSELRLLEGLQENKDWLFPHLVENFKSVEIFENGIKYSIDFYEGQKTGFFLDQKYNRRAASAIAQGKRVLDCFTHTGSFALNMLAGGAEFVTAVDSSEYALSVAKINAGLNPELGTKEKLKFVRADVFDLLKALVENKNGEDWNAVRDAGPYDMIILDPPAFAKQRACKTNSCKGYKEINMNAMRILPRGGYLATASCSRFINEKDFIDILVEAAKSINRRIRIIEKRGQASDHPVLLGVPETDYLKFLLVQVI